MYDVFLKLGFTKCEVNIYNLCLKNAGGLLKSQIEEEIIDCQNLKSSLDRLGNSGFITKYSDNGENRYIAEPPENMKFNLEQSVSDIASIISMLKQSQTANAGINIRKFEGAKSIEFAYNDIISTLSQLEKDERYLYQVSPKKSVFEVLPNYNDKFVKKRVKNNIVLYWIAPKTEHHWCYTTNPDANLRYSKLFDENEFPFEVDVNVYADKISFITLEAENVEGIIIENKFIANSLKHMCRYMWEHH